MNRILASLGLKRATQLVAPPSVRAGYIFTTRSVMKGVVQTASISLVVAVVVVVGEARAAIYDFTYTDSSGDAANGQLTVQPSGLGDGSLWATGGFIDVTAPGGIGIYPLWTSNQVGPSPTTIYGFTADDLLFPLDNGASSPNNGGVTGNPTYLSTQGLLFGKPPVSQIPNLSQGFQVNLWGNGAGDYAFATWVSSNPIFPLPGTYPIDVASGGAFKVTQVPEPPSLTLLGAAFLGLGVVYLRRRGALARQQNLPTS